MNDEEKTVEAVEVDRKKLFQERLNRLMEERGISPAMMAIRANITSKSVRNYQKGLFVPGPLIAGEIARVLQTSVDYLLGMEEEKDAWR